MGWGLSTRISRNFEEWLAVLDPDVGKAMGAPGPWALVTINVLVSLGAARYAPGAEQFFQIDVVFAFLLFVPALAVGLLRGVLERRNAITRRTFGRILWLGLALFQYFMWSLVSLSRGRGAALMVVFPVLLAAFHGLMLRSAPRYPYVPLAAAAGAAASWLLHGLPQHVPLFAVGAPAALFTALICGQIGLNNQRARMQALALREAIAAQAMHETMERAMQTRDLLLRLQTHQHDAGNALSGVLLSAERLALEVGRAGEAASSSMRAGARELLGGLDRLRQLFEASRKAARTDARVVELVDLSGTIEDVLAEARRLEPAIGFQFQVGGVRLQHLAVPMCGGRETFRRVVDNLIRNACQGDGVRRARSVRVRLDDAEHDAISVAIEDDGPGFPSSMLAAPFAAFTTTKAHGSGLGLYTCDRLIRASGGHMTISNHDGGACVQINLRREQLS